jgi:subtilisin family serine protease
MRSRVHILILVGLLVSAMFVAVDVQKAGKRADEATNEMPADDVASVSIRFARELSQEEIQSLEEMGLRFGANPKHIGRVYMAEGSKRAIDFVRRHTLFESAEPQTRQKLVLPRDVSAQQTYADLAWNLQDHYGVNTTGEGVLIADLDTGIQWNHPDFYFADGTPVSWTDVNTNGVFTPAVDGVEYNGVAGIQSDELLRIIDVNNDGSFQTDIDWLWIDNGTASGTLDKSDTKFVAEDADGDTVLDLTEQLVPMLTPKTKYLVHKPSNVRCWERGVNLTSTTFKDTDGHGTSVAGILNGGQLGYHKYLGLAPMAELMAINIFGSDGLTVEEGLIWAKDHGADVILIEIGAWTYEYLDGTSNVEVMIDQLVAEGIPVIVPAGNLYGQKRHAELHVQQNTNAIAHFVAPSSAGTITKLYITVLANVSLSHALVDLFEPTATGTNHIVLTTIGSGYKNWATLVTSNFTLDSFRSASARGTHMLAFYLSGTIMHDMAWLLNINNNVATNYQFYIADDQTGWGGGAEWQSGLSDSHTISWPSTADSAISVGAYSSRSIWTGLGLIAPYSSEGPRVDGSMKMSVAAPGDWDVVSSYSNDSTWPSWLTQGYSGLPVYSIHGGNLLFSGTSAAGPHVAAAAALMLQVNDRCGSLAKQIIESAAYNDTNVGSAPNTRWGYGKLNVCAAVEEAQRLPIVKSVSVEPATPMYYQGMNVSARVSHADSVDIVYSNDTWSSNVTLTVNHVGGWYNATVPMHPYLTQVDVKVIATNSSGMASIVIARSCTVGDDLPPTILNVHRNVTTVYATDVVEVRANVSEPALASGIASVLLEYSTDNWSTYNLLTMNPDSGLRVAVLPVFGAGTNVSYRVWSVDSASNSIYSSSDWYVVQASTTTTTTTTTTTSTTTTTTTTETTTTTTSTSTTTSTTTPPGTLPDMSLYLAIGFAIAMVIAVILAIRKRRR